MAISLHAISAGVFVRMLTNLQTILAKAETGEDAGGARRRAMRVDRVQPLVNFADSMRIIDALSLSQKLCALGRGSENSFERR